MGFVIWYKLQIEDQTQPAGGLLGAVASLLGIGMPVKFSNDVLSGQYIVDADITLHRQSGPLASTFEMKVTNVPKEAADLLNTKFEDGHKSKKPLQVKAFLGYFDDAPLLRAKDPNFTGVITKLKSSVNDAGVWETTIKGQEVAGYALRSTPNPQITLKGDTPVQTFLEQLLARTTGPVTLAPGHGLDPSVEKLKDYTTRGRTVLEAIRDLTDHFDLPVVVRDSALFVKNAVGGGSSVATLSEDTNIVKEDDQQEAEEPDAAAAGPAAKEPAAGTARAGLTMTVLGDATLRPGQPITVKHAGKTDDKWRIEAVDHTFSTTAVFTSVLSLVQADPGKVVRAPRGATGVVRRVQEVVQATQRDAIDVGEISDYAPGIDGKHLATLNYGQSPPAGTVQASVTTPISADGGPLVNKPIVSPFAFHKCGLMVPIYPKMRAVLAHNQGQTNDALVDGFVWAESPRLEPPQNKPGDYWLCLPTELTNGLPSGKGVNDLTDAAGERVIQAKGLKIFVGSSDLPEVGKRPDVPSELDGTIVIQHEKGAKVTITTDGAVQIETQHKDISLTNGTVTLTLNGSSPEMSLSNGSVTLKLSGSSVEISS